MSDFYTKPVSVSSSRDDWGTPLWLFRQLDNEFRFTLDVCALPSNAKCDRYFSPEDNALVQPWDGVCWMNPPYGKTIGQWMKKAYEASCTGAVVVCLIPARTDTSWWHDYALLASEIRFLRGRLKFQGAPHNAPFPSAIVIFRPGSNRTTQTLFDEMGATP